MANFKVYFPLPPRELSPNRHLNWRALSLARRQYHSDCALALMEAQAQHKNQHGGEAYAVQKYPVVFRYAFIYPPRDKRLPATDYRPRDVDNAIACLKPLQDALTKGGVIKDDSSAWVSDVRVAFVKGKTAAKRAATAGIELEIIEAKEDA